MPGPYGSGGYGSSGYGSSGYGTSGYGSGGYGSGSYGSGSGMSGYGSGAYGAGTYGTSTPVAPPNPPLPPTPLTSYRVFVAGNQLNIIAGSLTIDSTIGRRSTASFTAWSSTATHFQQYQQVEIYDQNNQLIFSGYITQPKEQKPGFSDLLEHSITCCDQHYLADKRVVSASYTNRTCGSIVQDILNTILSQEGVTAGQIYDGLVPATTLYPSSTLYPGGNVGLIPSATFAYAKVSAALDELVKQASSAGIPYYWQIDEYKRLWFVPYTAVVNSTIVDGTQIDQVNNPPTVTRANPNYRNTQYSLGGFAQTVQQTETRMGDSNTVAWAMGYDLSSTPTITVNSVGKTVGIKGVDSGKDFYWQQGSPDITQDSGGTKLTSSDTLEVVYIGQYPSVFIAQNSAQISLQASIDGTSGIVEDVANDNTITSAASGLSEVGQLLTLYAQQGVQLVFTTLQTGFAQGQLVTVNLPMHGLYNASMLVEEVSASDQTDNFNIWSTVTCIIGPYDGNWVFFFSKLLAQQQPASSINIGVTQSVTILESFSASLAPMANLSVSVYSCPLPSTTQYPSLSLYPC